MTYKHTLWLFIGCLLLTGVAAAQTEDPIAWWKLDDGEGTVAKDSSGNGNDGTLAGDPTWVEGTLGGALDFDGNGDHVDCGNDAIFELADGFSLAVWINWRQRSGGWQAVVSKGDNSWRLARGASTSKMDFGFTAGGSRGWQAARTNSDVPLNEWHHVCATYDIAVGAKIYLNGVFENDNTDTGGITQGTHPVYLGENSQSAGRRWVGMIDEVMVFDRALSEAEIAKAMAGWDIKTIATNPNPKHEETDVERNTDLNWTADPNADNHDVYLGTNFDDVNTADPASDVFWGNQTETTAVLDRLELGETYFWRVDEIINSVPVKGDVWQFTVEPQAYALTAENITVSASTWISDDKVPQNLINGSGIDEDGKQDRQENNMWLSEDDPNGSWLEFAFDKAYKIQEMRVWNHNTTSEMSIGYGMKDVVVSVSADGNDWTPVEGISQFAQATGDGDEGEAIDLAGITTQYVRIESSDNYSPFALNQHGLSEVLFLVKSVWARLPQPETGSTNVNPDVLLSWRAGVEAAQHEIWTGTDPNALTLLDAVDTTSYPLSADLAQTTYWQIVEVNEAETPAAWTSDVWSFSTVDYINIDNFNSYNDTWGNIIFQSWVDGLGWEDDKGNIGEGNGTGSAVGYWPAPTIETAQSRDGNKSMPLAYASTESPTSEAVYTLDPEEDVTDWTQHGIKSLSLWFYGAAANTPGDLYIKINGTKIDTYPYATDLQKPQWFLWTMDLPAGLTEVKTLTVGIEGGEGTIFVDTIRLYPVASEMITPTTPDESSKVGHYTLDGNTNDSAGPGPDGTPMGDPVYVPGPAATQGLSFDGSGSQYVDLGTWNPSEDTNALTVSVWAKWEGLSDEYQGLVGKRDGWNVNNMMWHLEANKNSGKINFQRAGGGGGAIVSAQQTAAVDEWEHWAVTADGTTATIYRNGLPANSGNFTFANKTDANMQIGSSEKGGGNPFKGALADVRIYNNVLSAAEIAGLAGRTDPFYKLP